MSTSAVSIEAARDAQSRYAWREAFELLAAADAVEPLGAGDLDQMAECAWWIGKMRHCIALRERSHAAYLKDGNVRRAARVASDLAEHHADLMELPTASAWIQKAARLLEDEPESAEHGWVLLIQGSMARLEGDWGIVAGLAGEASAIAARFHDKDLFALAHAVHGLAVAFGGDTDAGLAMLEEATVGAVNNELGPRATGWIYCMMIATNAHIADWQRAGRWSEAATAWCNRQAINGFPGVCRVHRAEIMRLRGDLSVAEEEARMASLELASFNLMFTALAFQELGEVRLKMGDLDAAEEAFRQAQEMGVTPQPGLTQALLQRGKTQAAGASIRRALADRSLGALDRAKLLPTQVEVALLLDDLETARAATAELHEIAVTNPRPALCAAAAMASAAVELAAGDLEPAVSDAQEARVRYREGDLPYDVARASLLLGRIHLARGAADQAAAEASTALATFDSVGAVPDAATAREVLADVAVGP
jgi:tetratricopeptide (TPR) repeat protein